MNNLSRVLFRVLAVVIVLGAGGCATALIQATEQGDVNTVETMLAKGADINELAPDSGGRWYTTPVAHAAKNGHLEAVKLLIDKGADLNMGNPPPLVFAALYGQADPAKLLLEKGADANHSVAFLESIINNSWGMHDEAKQGIELIKALANSLGEQRRAEDEENFLRWGKFYRGEVGGIGLQLKKQDEWPIVEDVLEGETAAAAGIKIDDKIIRVGARSTKDLGMNEVVNLIIGPIGTEVTISILRGGSDNTQDLTITRAKRKFVFPEEARKFKVQAESAVRERNFVDAAALYGKVIYAAPWWPEGHFNRAIVLSETGNYSTAIVEMKRYLMLVPAAPDARAAQDKIYEWERKTEAAGVKEALSQPQITSTSSKFGNSGAVKVGKGGK